MLIPWLVVGIVFIVLAVALFKSASTWNWVPIVAVLFIFVTAIFAGITASRALKTRAAWLKKDLQNENLAATALVERDEVLYGPANAIKYSDDSLVGINNTLNLLTIGEGRIWRSGQPTAGDQGKVSLTFTPPEGDSRPSPATQLKQDMQVYAFADQGTTIDDVLVTLPVQYVGTWLVDSAANDTVTLKPVFVTKFSAGEAAMPTTTWTLFETMPGDSPQIFKTDFAPDLDADELDQVDLAAFRDALRTKYLPAESMGLDPDSKEYEALLDEYTFNGLSLNVIQQWIDAQSGRINDRFDPDDTFRDIRLRFTERGDFQVDGSGNVVTDGTFDNQGLSNDPNLHLGSSATIPKDDEILASKRAVEGFPGPAGNIRALGEDYEFETIVDFYRRQLRDYPFALSELDDKAQRMRESLAAMKADIEVSQAMIDNTNDQIRHRGDLIVKLQSDISRREQELTLITTHRQNLEQELAKRQQQIQTYYQQILELHRRLKKSLTLRPAPVQTAPVQDTSIRPTGDPVAANPR